MTNATTIADRMRAWAIADLRAVISAQEEMARAGMRTPKLSTYWDQLFALLAAK